MVKPPRGPIASQGWSVPEYLRKPVATCDIPVGFRPPVPHLDPPIYIETALNF